MSKKKKHKPREPRGQWPPCPCGAEKATIWMGDFDWDKPLHDGDFRCITCSVAEMVESIREYRTSKQYDRDLLRQLRKEEREEEDRLHKEELQRQEAIRRIEVGRRLREAKKKKSIERIKKRQSTFSGEGSLRGRSLLDDVCEFVETVPDDQEPDVDDLIVWAEDE